MEIKEFRLLLANEIAMFINSEKEKFGDFADFNLMGGGLTFTDFYKYLAKKIEQEGVKD